jgi:hypothetical protein
MVINFDITPVSQKDFVDCFIRIQGSLLKDIQALNKLGVESINYPSELILKNSKFLIAPDRILAKIEQNEQTEIQNLAKVLSEIVNQAEYKGDFNVAVNISFDNKTEQYASVFKKTLEKVEKYGSFSPIAIRYGEDDLKSLSIDDKKLSISIKKLVKKSKLSEGIVKAYDVVKEYKFGD